MPQSWLLLLPGVSLWVLWRVQQGVVIFRQIVTDLKLGQFAFVVHVERRFEGQAKPGNVGRNDSECVLTE